MYMNADDMPKQNYCPLVELLQCDKSHVIPVMQMYGQLMVTTDKVELCKYPGAVQPIDEIFYIQKWVSVFVVD